VVDLQIGYLPGGVITRDAAERRRIVAESERAGLDHLAVGDHVSFFVGAGSDGLVQAASLLTAADRLAVNTAVYLLPLRHPVVVARQLVDISLLAPGRFVFGVGVGGEDPHELEICGVDPRRRGRRMDECLAIVRALLTGTPLDFDGEFFSLSSAQVVPAPSVPIPICVGGRSSAAVRRAGRLGDGWWGIWVSARRYADAIAEMRAHAADAGRGEVAWVNGLNLWCGVGADRTTARARVARAMETMYQLPFESFERYAPYGEAAEVAEFVAPYAQAGCSRVNLIAVGASPEQEIEAVARVRALVAS
jgi:alkanesulfonate monooxygenase SsuD/methylene tetrahydromethanopterin reductase-like flavin-dependent oxidoreductase (luciferase family)